MKALLFKSLFLILSSSVLLVAAQTSPQSVPVAQLKSNPFTAGALRITVTSFKGNGIFATQSGTTGYVGTVHVEVENTSDSFVTFEPGHFSVVDRNQNQADVLGLDQHNDIYPAESRRIAPKATIKAQYILTGKVDLPARIYYEDQLLGTVRE